MFEKELETAREAVRLASCLCQRVRQTLVSEETIAKSDRSPVTVADYASQAVINHTLARDFPDDAIVGEEDASALRSEDNAALREKVMHYVNEFIPGLSEADALAAIDRGRHSGGNGRFWTLDPIDGTKGYIRGDQYAVALALLERGEVVLGVLGCPNLAITSVTDASGAGSLFTAVKGRGARAFALDGGEPRKLSVSSVSNPSEAVFCESFESGHSAHNDTDRLMERLAVGVDPVRIDSQAKYALVARGEASVYLRLPTRPGYREKIWDHAAGWLVVSEAGGRITDINGKPFDFTRGRALEDNRGLLVTNSYLHEAMLSALRTLRFTRTDGT